MKTERNYAKVIVQERSKKRLQDGHPWVYDNEVIEVHGAYENGDIVDVRSHNNIYLGSGFINDHSKIRVRIISRNANDRFDDTFYMRRLQYAYEHRKTVMRNDMDCCRLIFGEADMFPGFTVDRFGNMLVAQTLSLGIERIKHRLFAMLTELLRKDGLAVDGIYERNESPIRTLEGLETYKGFFGLDEWEALPSVVTQITENGIRYNVDIENGQKTGFFLDQKYNRQLIAHLSKDKKVLDCCTHTGSFALNAAQGGAKEVVALDVSKEALAQAAVHAEMNGLQSRITFIEKDVFDYLRQPSAKDFDLIVLDPPAFTKSTKTVRNAQQGYLEINTLAMKLLPRGGYLATCSCSHFMESRLFLSMLHDAARAANVTLRQLSATQQAWDHPILWNVPETNYLKFYIFQII